MQLLNPSKACGNPWPEVGESHLPNWYRVLGGGPYALEAAKHELCEHFRVTDLTTSEGVYLRWCVQHCLRQHQAYGKEICHKQISSSMQINPVQEAVIMWLNDLYLEGLYGSDVPQTYIGGRHFGEEGQRFADTVRLLEVKRMRAREGEPN